jgi:DNA repair protein RadA/Sms
MDQPLKKGSVYIGEVGLGGEVRAVPMLERRVSEAKRAGFGHVVVPGKNLKEIVKAI